MAFTILRGRHGTLDDVARMEKAGITNLASAG